MVRQTFSKADRLLKKAEFDAVFAVRQSVADRRLVVFYKPNGLDRSRLGLAVGKAFGGAPERNRFKRRVRELFRRNRDLLPAALDLIVLPAKSGEARTATFEQTAESWGKLLGRIRLS